MNQRRFAAAPAKRYDFHMSNLSEVETVVDRLTPAEQEQLLRRLETKLRRPQNADAWPSREDWMQRLDALRASIGSGTPASNSEQIFADLRED